MPAFSVHFGLVPADFDDMTFAEFDAYAKALEQIRKDHEKLERDMKKRRR